MRNTILLALALGGGCFSEAPMVGSSSGSDGTSGTTDETGSGTTGATAGTDGTTGATDMSTSTTTQPDVGGDDTSTSGSTSGSLPTDSGSDGSGSGTSGEVPPNGPYAECTSADTMAKCDVMNANIDPMTQCVTTVKIMDGPSMCVYWLQELTQTVDDCVPHPSGYAVALYEPNDPPGGSRYCAVTCAGGAECPPGWSCHPSLDIGYAVIPTDICWPD